MVLFLLAVGGGVSDGQVVGAAGDVVVPPFDHQDVLSLLLQLVADVVHTVAQMFHQDLLAGDFGTVDTDQEHVPTCRTGPEEATVSFYSVTQHSAGSPNAAVSQLLLLPLLLKL